MQAKIVAKFKTEIKSILQREFLSFSSRSNNQMKLPTLKLSKSRQNISFPFKHVRSFPLLDDIFYNRYQRKVILNINLRILSFLNQCQRLKKTRVLFLFCLVALKRAGWFVCVRWADESA